MDCLFQKNRNCQVEQFGGSLRVQLMSEYMELFPTWNISTEGTRENCILSSSLLMPFHVSEDTLQVLKASILMVEKLIS